MDESSVVWGQAEYFEMLSWSTHPIFAFTHYYSTRSQIHRVWYSLSNGFQATQQSSLSLSPHEVMLWHWSPAEVIKRQFVGAI
jgi:hypothetical protein